MADGKLSLRNENPGTFCVKAEARTLSLQSCSSVLDTSFISFTSLDETVSGAIIVSRNGKELYFGTSTVKIFSRVKLFTKQAINPSKEAWRLDYIPSPVYSPAPSDAVAVCGSSFGKNQDGCGQSQENFDPMSLRAVRCCADTDVSTDTLSAIKTPRCSTNVWGISLGLDDEYDYSSNLNSLYRGCVENKTFFEAQDVCESHGARLCTTEEVLDDCTTETGCGFNTKMVWASSTKIAVENSSAPSSTPSSPPPAEYEFLPINSAAQCPVGLEVPQDECKGAFESLWGDGATFVGQNNKEYSNYHGGSGVILNVNDWDYTPCGCFMWLNDTANFASTLFSTRVSDCKISITNKHSQVICKKTRNIALLDSATAWESSSFVNSESSHFPNSASRAIDGNTDGVWLNASVSRTTNEASPSWHVTWPAAHRISRIKVWNRTDCCGEKIIGFVVTVFLDGHKMWSSADSAVITSINKEMYDFDDIPSHIVGDKVEVKHSGTTQEALSLAEVQVFGLSKEIYNVARNKDTQQSSTWGDRFSNKAVDGDVRNESELDQGENLSGTKLEEISPFWYVLLGSPVVIDNVVIYNRDLIRPNCPGTICGRRLKGFRMEILNIVGGIENVEYTYNDTSLEGPGLVISLPIPAGIVGNKVKISIPGRPELLSLHEVQVFSRVGCFDVNGDSSNRVCQAPNLKVSYYQDNLPAGELLPVNGLLSLLPYKTDLDLGVDAIDFNWGTGKVLSSELYDNVAIRFVGYALFDDVGGTYSICTSSDDQSKVYIDGDFIVQGNWPDIDNGGACGNYTNGVAGVKRVVVEYREGTGGARCKIQWTPPNDGNRVVLPFIFAEIAS